MRITKKESNYRTAISSLSIGINRMAEWPLRHVSWSFHVILIFASCRHFAVISCVSSLPRRDLLSPNRLIGHWNSHVQFYNPFNYCLSYFSVAFFHSALCVSVCLSVCGNHLSNSSVLPASFSFLEIFKKKFNGFVSHQFFPTHSGNL